MPSFVLLAVFVIAPIIMSLYYSFAKYNGMSPPEWIGLGNFLNMKDDSRVWQALKNTGMYALLTVPPQIVVSLAVAALLAGKYRNKFGGFVRSVMFIPVLASSVLAGTIFFYIFSSDADSVMNTLVSIFGVGKIKWLGDKTTVIPSISFVYIWKGVGYFMVILYAAIMDIPRNLYEAAEMDGANGIQQFFHITLPGLKSVLYMSVTISTIWSFQVFDITYAMTRGGPGYYSTSLVLEIYKNAFSGRNFGYASAIAMILLICVIIITMIQRLAFKEKMGE